LEDVDEKSDKSGGSTTLIAPFAKKSLTPSNPRLEKYRHMIKGKCISTHWLNKLGSLSLGTHASFGVSEMNLSPFSRGEAMSDIGLSSASRSKHRLVVFCFKVIKLLWWMIRVLRPGKLTMTSIEVDLIRHWSWRR
jgi:hypothetical protein